MTGRTYTEGDLKKAMFNAGVTLVAMEVIMAELNKPKVTFREGEVGILINSAGQRIPVVAGDPGYQNPTHKQSHSELPQYVHDLVDAVKALSGYSYKGSSHIVAKEALAAYRKAGGVE